MKQIFKELWVENSNLVCLIGKSSLLLFILFGSLFLHDFRFTILFTFSLTSLEMFVMKTHGQIDYILPQTNYERKRKTIIKCTIVAGIYALTNTISYIWLVQRSEEYKFSYDIILFLGYMTAVVFLYFFYYRTGLCIVGMSVNELEKDNSASTFEITINSFGCLSAVVSCPIYIIYKFGKVDYPMFIAKNIGVIELCFGSLALTFLLYGVIKNIKRMDYSEYTG